MVFEEERRSSPPESVVSMKSRVSGLSSVSKTSSNLDSLCDALNKVDVSSDDGFAKSFTVVDDIEKAEYDKQVRSGQAGQSKKPQKVVVQTNFKLPPLSRAPPPATKKEFKVPREWNLYSKYGEVVATTPFLPFKTPFNEDRFTRHPDLEEHTIFSLISDLSARGIRLTFVIDLTLPEFYDTELLQSFDIRYEKIRIDNQEPRWHQIKRFLEICDEFANQQHRRRREWEERQRARKEKGEKEEYYMYEVIGVHCTRGVNRTGYMICRAMIERMNYSAEQAVEMFNKARGHNMTEWLPELKKAEEKKRMYASRGPPRGGGGRGRGGGGEYRGRGAGGGYRGGRGGGGQ